MYWTPSPAFARGFSLAFAILLGAGVLSPALAAGGKDCAPVGSMPDYLPVGAPQQAVYDSKEFPVADPSGGFNRVTITGQTCQQEYDLKKGADAASSLEVLYNYRDQFAGMSAQTVFKDDSSIDAKLVKDGSETWMYVVSDGNLNHIYVTVVEKEPFKATLIAPSGKDYRLLGHMPNYVLRGSPTKTRFDQYAFRVHSADGDNDVNVQGARYDLSYGLKKGAPQPSSLEVQENYRDALKKLGAVILYTDDSSTVARYDDKGQAIWMRVETNGDTINIYVIEEKAFQATIKPPDASAMKAALDKDGHIALYINFDFDKATLRPDAAPIVAQVIALLKNNPTLNLSVEGNTDNIGGHDYNVKLSQDRAAAVVAALVKAGIAAGRLKSSGNGPDKPIADNGDSMGRAKNRRVELVKM